MAKKMQRTTGDALFILLLAPWPAAADFWRGALAMEVRLRLGSDQANM